VEWYCRVRRIVVGTAALVLTGTLGLGMSWAVDIEALPGSTWGQATYEATGLTGPGVQGFVNQGIDWVTLPGKLTLNTFAELRYRVRENNKNFYNTYGPAVGVEFRRKPFHLGVDYYWERFPELSDSSNRLGYYLSWYYDWDLKR